MEARNFSNIFNGRPFLDNLYFLGVHMNPAFIDHHKT